MLLAVFSDSHGNQSNMISAVARFCPDQAIFLGDGISDALALGRRFPDLPLTILPGNCDRAACGVADSALLELEGVRIFAAHGHNHRVKYDMDSFCNAVRFSGAVLGLYGHTHRALWRELYGLQLMNPGSIGDPLCPTFGMVDIKDGSFSCHICDFSSDSK